MTKRLLIDTHSKYCLLSITDRDQMVAETVFLHDNQLNHTLLPTLKELLEQAEFPLESMEEIAFGIGPGSYTGTRIGASVARSLHFALKMRGFSQTLRGFYSLLTYLPPQSKGTFLCALPTKSGSFYTLEGIIDEWRIECSFSGLIDKTSYDLRSSCASLVINSASFTSLPSFQPVLKFLNNAAPSELLTDLLYTQ